MSKQPERIFGEKVDRGLDQLPNTWYENIQQVGIRGTPDRLCCINGHFVALELKVNYKATPLQQLKLNKIQKAKGHAFTVNPHNWFCIYKKLKVLSRSLI